MKMKRRFEVLALFTMLVSALAAQTWIWYPGDYEIWLGNQMNNRRTERGTFYPPFWKMDSHYVCVQFSKSVSLQKPENISIVVEGKYNISLDGKLMFGMPHQMTIPAGSHKLVLKVWNQSTPPTIFIKGKTVYTDSSWKVTYEDKEWIDSSGKTSDTSTTVYMDAGCWNFDNADNHPSQYALPRKPRQAISKTVVKGGILYDFGCETFGYVTLKGLHGDGPVDLYYGESSEEAQDTLHCETLDKLYISDGKVTDLSCNTSFPIADNDYTLGDSKAFRYVYITGGDKVGMDSASMQYEYMPEEYRGAFKCNDEELNRIWDVSAYTLHLATREFFIDGIKRDRWVWSGDAIQSYLMNYYLFFDSSCVKRSVWMLRGKDPVTSHTNTILDYTFYWFLSVYDYYLYSGDNHFVSQIYPRMQTMMDFVLGRTDSNGMVEGLPGDWVFVDWADGYMDKKGELSFEQLLLCKSLETMAVCADVTHNETDHLKYEKLASSLRSKLVPFFWNEQKQALVHNRINGHQSGAVTRYANIFAILFNYLNKDKQQVIEHSVLLNDSIMKITTPYMRFYELASLCAMGRQTEVMKEMKDYWGGMLKEGATSFWEKYNPDEKGAQHLAMYGRPYGKSLCHAWGASPIYLLGKYYLGVSPVKPGYEEFSIKPCLGGLKWIDGKVPTPHGDIHVYMNKKEIRVKADSGTGYLYLDSKHVPRCADTTVEALGARKYRVLIKAGEEMAVKYDAMP